VNVSPYVAVRFRTFIGSHPRDSIEVRIQESQYSMFGTRENFSVPAIPVKFLRHFYKILQSC